MKRSELRQIIREELIQLKSDLFAELTYKKEGKNWIIKYTFQSKDEKPVLNTAPVTIAVMSTEFFDEKEIKKLIDFIEKNHKPEEEAEETSTPPESETPAPPTA